MKRILFNIIILSFSTLLMGQHPSTNLDISWFSGYTEVTGKYYLNNSLGGYSTDLEVIKVSNDQLSNISAGYINAKDSTEIVLFETDTLPITCLFWNYNAQDTLYFEMLEHTINSDSTENLPYRLNSIAHYSTSTDARSYFSGVEITGTMHTVCASGCDYSTIQAAVSASTATDTIIVKSGEYVNSTFYNINKQLYLLNVGNSSVSTTTAQAQTISIDADDVKLKGFKIDGKNNNGYGIYIVIQTGVSIENNTVINHNSRSLYIRGSNTNSYNYVYNNVLKSSGLGNTILAQTTNTIVSGNYITGISANAFRDISIVSGYSQNVEYNKIDGIYTNYWILEFVSSELNVKYNNVNIDSITFFMYDNSLSSSYTKYVNVIGNKYTAQATTNASGFINTTANNTKYYIYNNNITINDHSTPINIDLDSTTVIKKNTITIEKGSAINAVLSNNKNILLLISENDINITSDPDESISTINIANSSELWQFRCIIEKNIIKNSKYFNIGLGGGHGNMFISNVPSLNIRYNKLLGSGVGAIIIKGYTGTTAGIHSKSITFCNLLDNTYIVKGARNTTFIQNTIRTTGQAVEILREALLEDSDSSKIKNNIIYSENSYPIYFDQESFAGVESDYNIIYSKTSNILITVSSINYNFNNWQSLGYDLNSYNTNPNFRSSTQLWPRHPSNAIGHGFNLGNNYKEGLDITTSFPDNIITKNQLGYWSIGAYVVPLHRAATTNMKILLYNNKYLKF